MKYVSHKFIKPESMQSRLYQEAILATAIKKNTLCVLPTGLGKTNIAVLLTAHMLDEKPNSKVLFVAPTRPLVQQHYNSFTKFIDLPADDMQIIMGTMPPGERQDLYDKRIIFATPQTIANDLENRRFSLAGFGLLIIDEIHHAVGRYAYPRIAEVFLKESNGRILGLTASPGEDRKKIDEICRNCGIENVEIRTEESEDVIPYMKEKEVDWINVELPKRFDKVREMLKKAYEKRLDRLRKLGFLRTGMVSKKLLLKLQADLSGRIKQGDKRAFIGISFTAQAIKIEHALGLLETQGISVLENYWKKMRSGTNSDMRLAKDADISASMSITHEFFEEGIRHPKIGKLCSLVTEQLRERPDSKIIIFANYRDSVKEIVSVLSGLDNINPVEFVGQREGMTQKEQAKRLDDFRSSRHNTLVCTSVGEEGIDIPAMDLAIFYEPVPSAIRSIQRRGRVGRTDVGKIVILITKDTRDEAYYWVAKNKEKRMHKTIYGMKHGLGSSVEDG
jgi:Fanconi anemia group M protein